MRDKYVLLKSTNGEFHILVWEPQHNSYVPVPESKMKELVSDANSGQRAKEGPR